MKLSKLLLLFFVFISLLLLNNCEAVTEQNDECEKTKWEEVKEPIVNIIASVNVDQYFGTGLTPFKLDTANYIEIAGSIQKYYCNGTPSGKFDFTTTFFPDTASYIYEILLGQAYQFKFQNDADHLRVNLKWKVYFNHGLTYESKNLVTNFYYKDIYFSNYWLSYVVYYLCVNFDWVKVT